MFYGYTYCMTAYNKQASKQASKQARGQTPERPTIVCTMHDAQGALITMTANVNVSVPVKTALELEYPDCVFMFLNQKGICPKCGKTLQAETRANILGECCRKHMGQVGYQKPVTGVDGLIRISELCNLAERLGRSRGMACSLGGGDHGWKKTKPENTVYERLTYGNNVYCKREAATALYTLITGKTCKFEQLDLTKPDAATIAKAKAGK